MLKKSTLLGGLLLVSASIHAQKIVGSADFPLVEYDVLLQAEIAALSHNPQTQQINVYAWQSLPGTIRPEGQRTDGVSARAPYFVIQQFDASGKPAARQTEVYSLQPLDATQKFEHQSSSRTQVGHAIKAVPIVGAMSQVPTKYPELNFSGKRVTRVEFIQEAGATGLNRSKYSLFPKYTFATPSLDNVFGGFITIKSEETPQADLYKQKFLRYIPKPGDLTQISEGIYQGYASVFDENDKNSMYRNMRFMNFDDKGALLAERPVTFKYNRELVLSLPVRDPDGKCVGTYHVFGSGPGKKEFKDPVDNNFNVVIFDEKGNEWANFDFQNGSGSSRAVLATHVMRKGDKIYLFNLNQQKLFNPLTETWVFDKSGAKTLLNAHTNKDLINLSKPVGTINGGNQMGWFDFYNSKYSDSFTTKNGDVFLLLQRWAPEEGAAAGPIATSTIGQPSNPVKVYYNDLFVLQFDSEFKLKKQTVLGRSRSGNQVRLDRFRHDGDLTQYILTDTGNEVLTIRGDDVKLQRISPADGAVPAVASGKNYTFNSTLNTLYAVYTLPKAQEPNRARLVTVKMD